MIEFAPDDTPRCVEKPGTASFLVHQGISLLRTVYGFSPDIPDDKGMRIEFSIHPKARGYKRTHTLIWEIEPVSTTQQTPHVTWPNRFSRLLGDKAFGLLVADLFGVPVPRSLVIGRRQRPFVFGQATGSFESWLRTCPTEQDPGRYTTVNKWIDPFYLLANEDPTHSAIASIISQSSVPAKYSGAAITKKGGQLHIEGRSGAGDDLMLGLARPEPLPEQIRADIQELNGRLRKSLGHVRFEWVHDGKRPWIVQLHKGSTQSTSTILVPGEPSSWHRFQSELGLEALRSTLNDLASDMGIELEGEVGLTSHIADLARKSRRPTRIVKKSAPPSKQLLLNMETE